MYYLLLRVTVVLYVIGKRIVESRLGRSFVAIRENEIVAQCNGINIAFTKGVVFGLSAFYAGIGGALFADHARLHRARRLRHVPARACTSRSSSSAA